MRELDALVAEKVMGWEYIPGFAATMAAPTWSQGENVYLETAKWHPSTSISDAFLVVEEMRKRGYSMEHSEDPGEQCRVWFQISDDVRTCGKGIADTAPEAICRAALETVK